MLPGMFCLLQRWGSLVQVLVVLIAVFCNAATTETHCRSLLRDLRYRHLNEAALYTPSHSKQQLVFFLHIPRTAGRTFFSCLLSQGIQSRCNKKYDEHGISRDMQGCHLLSSHDDFSVMQQLPPDTAVVTQVRVRGVGGMDSSPRQC